jgi:arsenate reductase
MHAVDHFRRDSIPNVLFLCTGNSARSLLAERMISDLSEGRFRGFSAGSHPAGRPHPIALEVLRERGHDVVGCRSKSWNEFAGPGRPLFAFVFTLCDDAEHETCPVWPGRPANAHWGIEDPAACTGDDDEVRRAFRQAYDTLWRRIELFLDLPFEELGEDELVLRLQAIGRLDDD